jgi:predicted Zn-dependent protease
MLAVKTDDWHIHIQFAYDRFSPPVADVIYSFEAVDEAVEDFISMARLLHKNRSPLDMPTGDEDVIFDPEIVSDGIMALISHADQGHEVAIYSSFGNMMLRVQNCSECPGSSQN